MTRIIHPAIPELAKLLEPCWPEMTAQLVRSGVPVALTTQPLKDKLAKVEAELAQARDERADAVKERDRAAEEFAGSESLSQDSDEFQAAQAAVGAVGTLDDRIAGLQTVQVETLKMLGRDAPEAPSRAAGNPTDPRGDVWDSQALFADEDTRQMLAHAAHSKSRFGGVELGEVASRDALVADITGTASMRRGDYLGTIPQLRRQLRVLDLIPTGTMNNNTLPYTQESGSFATATEVVEGDLKPEAGVTFTDATATAQTIAHWQKVRKQALADYAALQSIVDSRLRYGVERRLEGQVIAGNGADPNLRGILNTSGIGAVAFNGAELPADQVLRAITTVFLADAQATGIVMNPTNWETVIKAKAAGDGHYYSGGPFEVTPQVMWGVPLIPSASIPLNTVLVGDFQIGALLLIREGVNVLLSDSDQNDFITNRVTLLAEMRAALPVFRPSAFCVVALA